MFVLLVFRKSSHIKSCLPFEDYQYSKFHGLTLTAESFCIHLTTIIIHHFGMVETMGLKIMELRPP